MNQVSPPMRFALAATLVLVLVWFTVLKPKNNVEATATPTPATVNTSSTGTASSTGKTNSALDKTAYAEVGKAKKAAAAASADAEKQSAQTGESGHEDNVSTSTASAATATKSTAATTPGSASATKSTATATGATKSTGAAAATTPKLTHADRVILKIQKDLAAQKAVVVLVWSKNGTEDRELAKIIRHKIDLRGGKVKTFFIPVDQVGRYDGLLSGLSLAQTPSTIVIAPNNEAKVLGGLTSAARIDRLTSSAVLTKPAATKK